MQLFTTIILLATMAAAAAETVQEPIQQANYFSVTQFSASHIPHSSQSSIAFHWSDPSIDLPDTEAFQLGQSLYYNDLATYTYTQSQQSFEFLKDGEGGYILGLSAGVSHGFVNGSYHFPASNVELFESPKGSGFLYERIWGPREFLVPWKGYQ